MKRTIIAMLLILLAVMASSCGGNDENNAADKAVAFMKMLNRVENGELIDEDAFYDDYFLKESTRSISLGASIWQTINSTRIQNERIGRTVKLEISNVTSKLVEDNNRAKGYHVLVQVKVTDNFGHEQNGYYDVVIANEKKTNKWGIIEFIGHQT